ncbi:GNAT family N-acetyltransferase [Streptomyces sp. NPDC002328]|uniref:GNAT family N-acetyltransferase n=1 Tax=Streptomyces sp. NPDC002328 TaxID=3364642 RepID=UPI0036914D7A
MDVQVMTSSELLAHEAELRSVYVDAFCAPPWSEGEEEADAFVRRLAGQVRRPGFTAAIAFAEPGPVPGPGDAGSPASGRTGPRTAGVLGFATAWTTLAPFPTDRCYPEAAAGLGPAHTVDWLCGAREVDELAVRPSAHGTGVAARLLEAVTEGAPGGRSWLLTSVRSARAMAFYRRQGWSQATHPSPDGAGVAVFLGPRHPARSLTAQPL